MSFKQIAFIVFALLALGLFAANAWRFTRVTLLGRPANLPETWGQRIASLLAFFFGQRKVMEERSSWHHLAIYWGFLVVSIASAEMLTSGLVGDWFDFGVIIGEQAYGSLKMAIDVANLVVALALVWAFVRRIVVRPPFIPPSLDAMLILSGIMTLVITHYGHHAWHMAAVEEFDLGLPVSATLGQFAGLYDIDTGKIQSHVDAGAAHVASEAYWWGHVLVLLGFLNYLPFSKHIHVLSSGPNILLRPQGQRGVMPKLDLEAFDEKTEEPLDWGVGRLQDFTWKSLLDNYACTECARCTTYCPAFATDKPLSPMHLIHDLKDDMKSRGITLLKLQDAKRSSAPQGSEAAPATDPANAVVAKLQAELDAMPPLVGGRIKDETLWACTTCGACQEVCPVFIDHPMKILQMRTHIVLNDEGGRTPGELTRTFANIERSGNPWGLAQSDRTKWADDLEVPTIDEAPDAEYLLFVGCAGAYSDTSKKATRALVRCLQAANVKFAILGTQERCSGDPARRAGNEFLYQELAKQNVEAMNEAKVKKVVASCPHCFHTIKNEYPQLGGVYEVIHHSKLLAHLLDTGRLKVDTPLQKKLTYHDSCYLGRWNAIYDEPRSALAKVVGDRGAYLELERNREHGFCCGAGGGHMWMEEEPEKRVNINRAKEIVASGADTVAVACPFCKTMISDGVKHFNKDEEVDILDVAELIAAALPSIGAPSASPPAAEIRASDAGEA